MKITIRGYVYGESAPVFTEELEVEAVADNPVNEHLVRHHAQHFGDRPHCIEIEFPPDPARGMPATYFRIGTDPRLMRIPVPLVNLSNIAAVVDQHEKAMKAPWN